MNCYHCEYFKEARVSIADKINQIDCEKKGWTNFTTEGQCKKFNREPGIDRDFEMGDDE